MSRSFLPVLQAFNVVTDSAWKGDLTRFASAAHSVAGIQTAAFTAGTTLYCYPCNTTAGGFTATLPPAKDLLGKPYLFKNTGTVNNLTVAASGSDLIDTSATATVIFGTALIVISDGVSKWYGFTTSSGAGGNTIVTQDEGVTLSSGVTTLNFVGAGVTASGAGATTTVTIPAGTTITTKDEGVTLSSTVNTIDFVGAGVTATGGAATTTVTIPGAGSATITTQDEGVTLSTGVTTLNFTGGGVTASGAAGTTTVNIPTGAGTGDMLAANNLSDVVNKSTSYQNLTFLNSGTGGVARGGRTKMQETAVSVKDFGAVGDGVTDDTVNIQKAIAYVNSVGGGDVLFPVAIFKLTGVLSLFNNVNLIGMKEGPFDIDVNPATTVCAPTLSITNTVTDFITSSTGTDGNNAIKNLCFVYPNQIAPTSAGAITVYPWTIKQQVGGMWISKCTFVNSYDCIWFNNGRGGITDSYIGCLHTGLKFDVCVDYNWVDNVQFQPLWTYANGLAWPQNIDLTLKTNASKALHFLRCDGCNISNIGTFGYLNYGLFFTAGTTIGFTGATYGHMTNIDLDSCMYGIYAVQTRGAGSGVRITNINIGYLAYGVYMDSGGADPPQITMHNVGIRNAGGTADYFLAGGELIIRDMRGSNGNIPARSLTPPGVGASTAAVTNPYPWDMDVYINGGTVTDVAIAGTSTGGPRGAVKVPANKTIAITYSAAPTWTWFSSY